MRRFDCNRRTLGTGRAGSATWRLAGRNREARAQWHEAVLDAEHQRRRDAETGFSGSSTNGSPAGFCTGPSSISPRWSSAKSPGGWREQDSGIQALWSLLEALRQAERGDSVFPLSVPPSEWRSPTPHTDLPRRFQDAPLRSWVPARVEGIDQEDGVAFLLAARTSRPPGTLSSRYFEIDLRRDQVEASAWASPGTISARDPFSSWATMERARGRMRIAIASGHDLARP